MPSADEGSLPADVLRAGLILFLALCLAIGCGAAETAPAGDHPGRDASSKVSLLPSQSLDSAWVSMNESGLPVGTIWSFAAYGDFGARSSWSTSTADWSWTSPTNFTWSYQVSNVVVHNSTGNTTLYPSPGSGVLTSGGPKSWAIAFIHFSKTPPPPSKGLGSVNLVLEFGTPAAIIGLAAIFLLVARRRHSPPPPPRPPGFPSGSIPPGPAPLASPSDPPAGGRAL